MMKKLQNLGKALMLPVAVLPIASILMGIGYALCPAAVQGGEITGTAAMIGFFFDQGRRGDRRQHAAALCDRCRCRAGG